MSILTAKLAIAGLFAAESDCDADHLVSREIEKVCGEVELIAVRLRPVALPRVPGWRHRRNGALLGIRALHRARTSQLVASLPHRFPFVECQDIQHRHHRSMPLEILKKPCYIDNQ